MWRRRRAAAAAACVIVGALILMRSRLDVDEPAQHAPPALRSHGQSHDAIPPPPSPTRTPAAAAAARRELSKSAAATPSPRPPPTRSRSPAPPACEQTTGSADAAAALADTRFAVSDAAVLLAARPNTMVSLRRLDANLAAVDYIVSAGLGGDFVETGVAAGGSSASLVLGALARRGFAGRRMHLFDTFAGMPPANASVDGDAALEWTGRIAHGVEAVTGYLSGDLGIPPAALRVHAGDVLATPPGEVPCVISLLRIDTDWHASVSWALAALYPRLVPGGVVIIDDYGHWVGSRRATDEWLAAQAAAGVTISLTRIDQTGVMFCKPGGAAACPLEAWAPKWDDWQAVEAAAAPAVSPSRTPAAAAPSLPPSPPAAAPSRPAAAAAAGAAPSTATGDAAALAALDALHEELSGIAAKAGNRMGHPGNTPAQAHGLWGMLRRERASRGTVCEVGFNVGHGAATIQAAAAAAGDAITTYYAFDLVASPSVSNGLAHLRSRYPGTDWRLVPGSSQETLPAFRAAHPNVTCDLFHIDGDHGAGVHVDAANALAMAAPGALVVFDDCGCPDAWWCVEPTRAFEAAVRTGALELVSFKTIVFSDKGTCAGRVVPKATKKPMAAPAVAQLASNNPR